MLVLRVDLCSPLEQSRGYLGHLGRLGSQVQGGVALPARTAPEVHVGVVVEQEERRKFVD
jgi:hypothetical protein